MNNLSRVMSCSESHFYCCSVDANMIMYGIGDLSFRIIEHIIYEGNEEVNIIEDEMRDIPFTDLSNYGMHFAEELHNTTFGKTVHLKLELEVGGFFDFTAGELHLNYNHSSSAKEGAIRILNAYGYFGAEHIWQLMRYNDGIMFHVDDCFLLQSPTDVKKTVDEFIKNDTIVIIDKIKKEEEARLEEEFKRMEKDGLL